MAIQMSEGFKLRANYALDDRIVYSTKAEMTAMEDFALYDGIIAYCVEDGVTYQWKSTNDEDETLKKWKKFTMDTSDIQTNATLAVADSKLGVAYGNGLTVDTDGKLAADTTAVQAKLTAGTGVKLEDTTVGEGDDAVVNHVISVDDTVATKSYVTTQIATDGVTIVRSAVADDAPEGTVGAFKVDVDAIVADDKGLDVTANAVSVKAGEGITVDANGVSVDYDDVQHKLTAGDGITLTTEYAKDEEGQPTSVLNYVVKVADSMATKTYVDDAVDTAVAAVNQFDYQKVDVITDIATVDADGNITGLKLDDDSKAIAKEHIIYLVPQATDDQVAPDIFDEYIVQDGKLELIGNTDTHLENYYTKTEVDNLVATAAAGGVISAALTPNQTVGGASSATPFAKDTAIETILRTILIKEIAPTMTAKANTTAFNTGLEYGTTVAAQTGTVTITYNSASAVQKLEVYQDGSLIQTVDATTGKETSLTFDIPAVTANTTFKVVLTYVQSDGSTTKTLTVDNLKYGFVYKSYYGALSAVPTAEADITGLTSKLLTSVSTTNTYTTSNQMMVYATPYTVTSYEGATSTIVDTATGYKLNWSHTTIDVTVTAADSTTKTVTYNVYYSGVGAVSSYNVKFS